MKIAALATACLITITLPAHGQAIELDMPISCGPSYAAQATFLIRQYGEELVGIGRATGDGTAPIIEFWNHDHTWTIMAHWLGSGAYCVLIHGVDWFEIPPGSPI